MTFQWSDNVTWHSIKDFRGTTYVQQPAWFRFALQQAQHAILRAIIHKHPSSLLGRPAVNASESNCAHYLDARLELFWAEDWSALWAMVRAECDVALVQNATRRTATEQKQSRIRKVATLARAGEKGTSPGCSQKRTASPSQRANCSRDQESLPDRPRNSRSRTGICVKCLPVRSCRAHPHHTPQDATTQRTWTARRAC